MLIAFLNFASHWLEATDPRLALRLDPLNGEARIGLISNGLAVSSPAEAELERLGTTAEVGAALAPVDARMWSLIGDIEHRLGKKPAAEGNYERALAVSRTEFNALTQVFDRAAARRDYGNALDCADILLRRWAGRSTRVEAAILAIAADPAGYKVLREKLLAGPPWRDRVLTAFARGPNAVMIGAELLADLAAAGEPADPASVSAVVRALIRFGRAEDAYRLFLLTRTEKEGAQAGFVFDGHFRLQPDGNPFGWRLDGRSSYEVARLPQGGLSLHFFDAPLTSADIAQTIALPPGDYRIEAQAGATTAILPKGLSWTIRCQPSGVGAARLDLPDGTYGLRRLTAGFSIGADCPVQELRLATGLTAESWQYRYSGSLRLDSVVITESGSQ